MRSLLLSCVVGFATAASASAYHSDDYGFPIEPAQRSTVERAARPVFSASRPYFVRRAPAVRTLVSQPVRVVRQTVRPTRLVLRPGGLLR